MILWLKYYTQRHYAMLIALTTDIYNLKHQNERVNQCEWICLWAESKLKSLNYKSVSMSMPAKTEGMIAVFLYSILHTSAHADWTTSVQLEMMLCRNVERYDAFIDLWDSLSVSDMMLWACGPRFSPLNRKHVSSSQRVMTRGASHK